MDRSILSAHQVRSLTFKGNNIEVNNLPSGTLSVKGFPEIRTGSVTDTIHHQPGISRTIATPILKHHRLLSAFNTTRVNYQTQYSLEETLIPFTPSFPICKISQVITLRMKFPHELAHFTPVTKKQNEAQERK